MADHDNAIDGHHVMARLHGVERQIADAQHLFKEALNGLLKASVDLKFIQDSAPSKSDADQVSPAIKPTDHRREHRMGRTQKIDADPELYARKDSMTFQQMADDVAANFPPERRVKRSAIHRWWSTLPDART